MMNIHRILFRLWLDGWHILVYCLALNIIASFLLGVPLYIWKEGIISSPYGVPLGIIYFVFYLPLVFCFAAIHLGKFPDLDKTSTAGKQDSSNN